VRGFFLGVAVVMVVFGVIVAVIADQADVDADQQREHEGLHEADEQFEEVERRGQAPFLHGAHRVHQVFAAEDVAEKPERERNRSEEDRDNFDQTRAEENQEQRIIDDGRGFVFVGFVAEDILQHEDRARVTHDKIKPTDERDGGERKRAVHVGIAGADKLHPFAGLVARHVDRSDARKKSAPVLNQNESEQRDQQRKRGLRDLVADDRRREIEHSLDEIFHDRLAARRDQGRASDGQTNCDNQNNRDHPTGCHAVRHGQRPDVKQCFRRGGHALRFRGERGRTGGDGKESQGEFMASKHEFLQRQEPEKGEKERLTPLGPSTSEMERNGRDRRN